MRYIVDANIFFSALYDLDSRAGALMVLAIERKVELYSTEHVREEMEEILQRKLGYVGDHVKEAVAALPTEWVDRAIYDEELGPAGTVVRDEADASLLALAHIMGCEVVTGDKEVLGARFRKVRVRRLRDAV